MSELKNFQFSLDRNNEEKKHFVDSDNKQDLSDTEEDSEFSEPEKIKLNPLPVHKAKRKRNTAEANSSGIDMMLMEHLLNQQSAYLKAQKTIFKLKTEIDTEEVKTRYLTLDLNNSQVKVEEYKESTDMYKKKYYNSTFLNVTVFMMLFAYLVFKATVFFM